MERQENSSGKLFTASRVQGDTKRIKSNCSIILVYPRSACSFYSFDVFDFFHDDYPFGSSSAPRPPRTDWSFFEVSFFMLFELRVNKSKGCSAVIN